MIVFNIPRDLWLTSNQRQHRMQVARATKTLRALGYHQAKQAKVEPMEHARLIVYISYPTRARRDALNCWPTVKALVDGIVGDAGVLPDDDHKHLVGPDLRVEKTLCSKDYAARLEFIFLPVDEDESGAA